MLPMLAGARGVRKHQFSGKTRVGQAAGGLWKTIGLSHHDSGPGEDLGRRELAAILQVLYTDYSVTPFKSNG